MNFIKKLILLLLLCCLLCGCKSEAPVITPPALVTRVQVTVYTQKDVLRRTYTSPQKMENVLYLLRQFDPYGKSDRDPELLSGRRFIVQIERSDGSVRIHRIIADRYYSVDARRWQKIEPHHCSELFFLVIHQKSDE